MKRFLTGTLVLSFAQAGLAQSYNYAEALQKTLYFYEAQQSGKLSPNNRVEWRGPSAMNDGKDIGADLTGGWYDAGDHWKSNLTMSFAAMTLAWSAVEKPEGWRKTGQMDELLESLIHVNRYFLKCVLNPKVSNLEQNLDIVVACGGREGVEGRNVHAMWAAAELADIMTDRPTFRLNKTSPGADIPAAMAAAMAASAIVIRENATYVRPEKGFDPKAFSSLLLDRAEKLTRFASKHMGPTLLESLPKEEQEAIKKARNLALRSDGKIVEIGYRADPSPMVFTAMTWLARAATTADSRSRWMHQANEVYDGAYTAENQRGFWKDFGAGNFGKLGAYNMVRLDPGQEKYHNELQSYCHTFTQYPKSPGGLRLREVWAHQWGSLRHANNAATIALYYSEWVQKSPPLTGNIWWKNGVSGAQMAKNFESEAKSQVNYALGSNPYGRSFLVGFGKDPFNSPHHRGAYGAWGGFLHFIPGKAEFRPTSRHILYGALIGGPDRNDVFLCGQSRRLWLPVPDSKTDEHDVFYKFPNRPDTPVRSTGYVRDPADQPVQDVMDAELNEVALDYNAGFTANLNWLCTKGLSKGQALAQFPPKEVRNNSLDLATTDRELFASGRIVSEGVVEVKVWNRTRWPSRVTNQLRLRIPQGDPKVVAPISTNYSELKVSGEYIELRFDRQPIYPGNTDGDINHRTCLLRIRGDARKLGLTDKESILPKLLVYDGANPPSKPSSTKKRP